MTHSRGKPHRVGDLGQRYAVSVFDDVQKRRIAVAYTENHENAVAMAAAAEERPTWKTAWVTDRQPGGR